MKNVNILWKFLKSHRKYQFIAICSAILQIVFYLMMPFAFKIFIDEALVNKDLNLVYKSLFWYFIIVLLTVIFDVIKSVSFKVIDEKNIKDARMTLLNSIRKTTQKKLDSYKMGTLMSYLLSDSETMIESSSSVLCNVIQNLMRIICGIVILALINFKLLLIVLLFLPLYLADVLVFNKPIKNLSKELQYQTAKITEVLQEHLNGSREIIINNKEEWEKSVLSEIFDKYIKIAVKNVFFSEASFNVGFLIYWFVLMVIYLIGGTSVIKGTMTIGTLILYSQYVDNIFMPCKLLIQQNISIQRCIAAGERYFDLIKDLEVKGCLGSKIPLKSFNNLIEFKNVSFKYNNEEILKNINFKINKGDLICIVGESGSGKSTLLKLLLKLYDVNEGGIFIDSINLKDIDTKDWYSLVSVFFQDIFLFNNTIYENIKFTNTNALEDEMLACIKKSQLEEVICKMDNGYETEVGEQGKNLSGGQKQRVAIARTLLKDAEIIIFDEPTSSLDQQNKKLILNNIKELKNKNKTILVVTHDVLNAHIFDKIIYLENKTIKISENSDSKSGVI